LRNAALLACCALATAAAAQWTTWTIGPRGAPGLWGDDERLALLAPLPEGLALVTVGLDGSEAAAGAGPRSSQPQVTFTQADLANPLEVTEAGSYAVVGNRLLVCLVAPGVADLAREAGETEPLLDAAISPDASCVVVIAADGRVLAATRDGGSGFHAVPTSPATRVQAANGSRVLLEGRDGRCVVVDLVSDTVLCDLPAPCALSGNGRRVAYVQNGALVRLDLAGGESTSVPLAGPLDALALDRWGGRIVVRTGTRLATCTWTGGEVRALADCGDGCVLALSPSGSAVAYAAGGAVHVATLARAAPAELRPLRVVASRDSLALLHPIASLRDLAARIASERPVADAAAGLIAQGDAGHWALYRHAEPSFTVRVPPEWTAEEIEGGVRLRAPEGGATVTVDGTRPAPSGARDALVARDPDVTPTPCLVGGVPGLVASFEADGHWETLYVAEWADGLVRVSVIAEARALSEVVRALVESLSLEPWPDGD